MFVLMAYMLGLGLTFLTLTLAIFYTVIVVFGAGWLGTIIDELLRKTRQRKQN